MDSLTQATLGAAMGELAAGRKAGYRGALWGAVAGTLPDLDVLTSPFVSEVQQLAIHRGLSHSLVFVLVASPVCGWLLARLHRQTAPSWRRWTLLALLVFSTHVLLDALTVYGTQVFQPFSDYPVAFNAIFIIDPLYTVPLLLGVLAALRLPRASGKRRLANYLGLGLSTGYLLLALGIKQHVNATFEASLRAQGIPYERYMTAPTAFNTVLWTGLADTGDALYVGLYSLLDDDPHVSFQRVDQQGARLDGLRDQRPVERLLWFSRGYYTVTRDGDGLVFHDLRFGRTDSWVTQRGEYLFNFRLRFAPEDPTRVVGFEQASPSLDLRAQTWRRFFTRILGGEDSE